MNGKDPMTTLILQAFEGSLSETQLQDFQQQLQQDPNTLKQYIELSYDHAILAKSIMELIDHDNSPQQIDTDMEAVYREFIDQQNRLDAQEAEKIASKRKKKIEALASEQLDAFLSEHKNSQTKNRTNQSITYKKISFYRPIQLIAACLCVAFLAWFLFKPTQYTDVAKLIQTQGAIWDSTSDSMEHNARLVNKTYHLIEGTAKIAFDQGTLIILQGPSKFELTSANGASLQLGKLTATVPPRAIGFQVTTPNASIIDYGTQFGVSVLEDGSSECHVFEGKVGISSNTTPSEIEELKSGQARLISTNGQISYININTTAFVKTMPKALNTDLKHPSIHGSYHNAILASNPILYWTFDQNIDNDNIIYNIMSPDIYHASSDDTIVTEQQYVGKNSANNKTLILNSSYGINSAREEPIKQHRTFANTIMFRLYIDDTSDYTARGVLQHAFCRINSNYPSQLITQINILDDGHLNYSIQYYKNNTRNQDSDTPKSRNLTNMSSLNRLEPKKWYHIAATYSIITQDCHLYINGISHNHKQIIPLNENYLGSKNNLFTENICIGISDCIEPSPKSFQGRIDDFTIYNRELTKQEISDIYKTTQ